MFELKENMLSEPLNDVDSIDNYISHFNTCKLIGVGRYNKFGIGKFIPIYMKDKQIFYKKADIELLLAWRSQLAPIKDLSSFLNIKSSKPIKAFLEKYCFRIIYDGTHPFGHAHLYYLEDLNIIEDKRREDIIKNGGRSENSNKHNLKHLSDDITYYTHNYACNILGIKSPSNKLKKLISCYYSDKLVFHKVEDVEKFLNLKKEIVPIKKLYNPLNIRNICSIIANLNKMGFRILNSSEQPFGKTNYYYKIDHDSILKKYFEDADNNMIDTSKYITYKDSSILFRKFIPIVILAKYTTKYKVKGIVWFLRKDIELFVDYEKNTITIPELIKQLNCNIGELALKTLLKEEQVQIIKANEHPLGTSDLVYKIEINKIRDMVEFRIKVQNESNRYAKYRLLISNISNNKQSISKTLQDFNGSFIFERFENNNNTGLPLTLSQTYEIISVMLNKDFLDYSIEDTNRILSILYNNDNYTQSVKIEFINFYNHLLQRYNIKDKLPYSISRGDMILSKRNSESYTQIQLINLFALLYKSLDDRLYLDKAIEFKVCAMVWLYMYLHYVTIWRAESITNIPIPDLNIIGFEDGESFIKWLREPSNTFTIEMGIKICDSVKRQVDSLNKRAKKNKQSLVFEAGRLMSRGTGLLLALCEAHRQIVEKNNKNTRKNTDTVITTWVQDYKNYYKLFGDKYVEIIGDTPFSNLRANKAFNNYTLNYSEENGDGIGGHILSIMRGHVVNVQGISNTTPIYETRHVDNTIEAIEATLFERGTFGFAKFTFLSLCDKTFMEMDSKTQTNLINELPLSPAESESVVKGVFTQREIIVHLITKMTLSEPEGIKELLKELAFGETVAKHNHTRCLLKAMLNSKIDDTNKEDSLGILEDYKGYSLCLMPESDYCCGCPMLVGETYFLYELNELIQDSIKSLASCRSEYERYMYSNIIFKSYMPILYEAQEVLGSDIIDTFMDIESIADSLNLLENENKILLKLERGNNDCS